MVTAVKQWVVQPLIRRLSGSSLVLELVAVSSLVVSSLMREMSHSVSSGR